MDRKFELYCNQYFNRIKLEEKAETREELAEARDKNITSSKKAHRPYAVSGSSIRSPGADLVSNTSLDQAVIKAYEQVPLPEKRELNGEYNFLIYLKNGVYSPSRHFFVPGNGGKINYSCYLGHRVDWSTVAAAAHTHPLYKPNTDSNRFNNRLNKHFSAGDPTILIKKGVPLFLRTPKGKQIKVLEIRDGWITTRKLSKAKIYNATKWKQK